LVTVRFSFLTAAKRLVGKTKILHQSVSLGRMSPKLPLMCRAGLLNPAVTYFPASLIIGIVFLVINENSVFC